MNEVRLSDVIVPEVFGPYVLERSLNDNRLVQAGIMQTNPQISSYLGGGGKTFNTPFWKDLTGDTDIPSETVDITINPIATDKSIVRRQFREKAWGSNDLAAALAGSDPFEAIGQRVSGFWARAIENIALYTIRGVFANNISADNSDLIVDISTEDGDAATSANKIGAKKTIEAIMKLGDMFDQIEAVGVHSVVYQTLLENDLIDFNLDSEGKLTIPSYMGLRLVYSDNMPKIAGATSGYKYHTYFFKSGALGYGDNSAMITPIETLRNPKRGGGIDELYTRRQFAIAPLGYSWVMGSDTGITPTNANLYDSASWDRVYDKKNTGIVAVISNG
jgi:hypothetical protein